MTKPAVKSKRLLQLCDTGAVGHFTATLTDGSRINIDTTSADAGRILLEADGIRIDTGPSNPYFNRIRALTCAIAWEKETHNWYENRNLALKRVRQCIVSQNTELDLWGMGLETLPAPLPDGITKLYVNANRLTALPRLPDGLSVLDMSNNPLTALPENLPPGLTILIADTIQLTEQPGTLPAGITVLHVNNNNFQTPPAAQHAYHPGIPAA